MRNQARRFAQLSLESLASSGTSSAAFSTGPGPLLRASFAATSQFMAYHPLLDLNARQVRFLHPAARPTTAAVVDPLATKDCIKQALVELAASDPDAARLILSDGLQKLAPTLRADVIRSAFTEPKEGAAEADLVDHVFNTVDENRDNQLSRSEFRSAVAAYAELKREDEGLRGEDAGPSNAAPSRLQLGSVALVAGVPFIFFGFMDNAGMLVFGEAVDMTLGHRLGLSAMASAACGNLISDVLGVSLSQMIDQQLRKMGFLKEPQLSMVQRSLAVVRRSRLVGSMIGITFGGVLGMIPLLFI